VETERAAALASVIAEWRGIDNPGTAGADAASWYRTLLEPFAEPQRPIESWGELYSLYGSTPDLVSFLRSHFVLHGSGALDIRYVPEDEIAAITDLNLDVVRKAVLRFRNPAPDAQDLALEDLIGPEKAKIFVAATTSQTKDDEPLIVTIQGPRLETQFVVHPLTHSVLEELQK
jgi:hypothetical protein